MEFTRREVFKKAILATPVVLVACLHPENIPTPTASKEVRPGIFATVDNVKDKGADIQKDHLERLLEALRDSGVPLWKRIGEHIDISTKISARPNQIPTWISNDSYPLKITVNDQIFSTVNSEMITKGTQSDFLVEHKNGPTVKYYEIDHLKVLGISLGLPSHIRQEGSLPEALYLAKEYISYMVTLRMALDGYDAVHPGLVTIKDKDGQPVTSREKQIAYGIAFALSQGHMDKTRTSYFWRGPDSLPIYILADGIISAIKNGKLPQETSTLHHFYNARNMLTDNPDLDKFFQDFNRQWVAADTMVPPGGLGVKAFQEPLFSAISTQHRTMYGQP